MTDVIFHLHGFMRNTIESSKNTVKNNRQPKKVWIIKACFRKGGGLGGQKSSATAGRCQSVWEKVKLGFFPQIVVKMRLCWKPPPSKPVHSAARILQEIEFPVFQMSGAWFFGGGGRVLNVHIQILQYFYPQDGSIPEKIPIEVWLMDHPCGMWQMLQPHPETHVASSNHRKYV